MKRICTGIIAVLMISISAYASFPPISNASWTSNFSKVEISEEPETQEEIEGKVYTIVSEPFRLSDYVDLVEEDEQGEQETSDEVVNDISLDTEVDDQMTDAASYDEDSAPVIVTDNPMTDTAIYEEEAVIEDKPVSDTEE